MLYPMSVDSAIDVIRGLVMSRIRVDFNSSLIHIDGDCCISFSNTLKSDNQNRHPLENILYELSFTDLSLREVSLSHRGFDKILEDAIKSAVADSFVKSGRLGLALDIMAKGLAIGGGRYVLEGYNPAGEKE